MSNIPYILEERPDTGMNNSKLGIWIFIASEIMLFGGLFSAYVFLRIAAPEGDFCLLYTSPSPRDTERSRMPSSA